MSGFAIFQTVQATFVDLEIPEGGRWKYNPDYSHAENLRTIGRAQILSYSFLVGPELEEEAMEEPKDYVGVLRVLDREPGVTDDEIKQAIYGLYRAGCSCERDCCGHYTGGARLLTHADKDDDVWTFQTHYSRNY